MEIENDDYYMSQEFYNEIMAEVDAEESKRKARQLKNKDRIFRAIQSVKGLNYLQNIRADIEYNDINGDLTLVKKPSGQKQPDNWGNTKGVWVNQHSSGDSGDCYYGEVYFPLKHNMWLSVGFAD